MTSDLGPVLRDLHVPLTGPSHSRSDGRSFCRGCGGFTAWPCITRRLLDGEDLDITVELTSVGMVSEGEAGIIPTGTTGDAA